MEYIPVNQATMGGGRMRDGWKSEREETRLSSAGSDVYDASQVRHQPGLEFANNKLIARRSTLDKRWQNIFKQQQVYQELGSNPFPRKYRLIFWQDQSTD